VTANAIFRSLYDATGAKKLLAILDVAPETGITIVGETAKLMFHQDQGCFILSEIRGERRAAKHTIEFVPYDRIGAVNIDLTDAARNSEEAIDRLKGMNASVSYQSNLTQDDALIKIDGEEVIQAVGEDDDAARFWDLVVRFCAAVVNAGIPVVVSAESE